MPPRATQDAAEFEHLLRDHVAALYRYAYRWTGSVDRAEDLVQDLLVRLYTRLAQLRSIERPRPWAVRIMYRIFIDQLRRERRSPVEYVGASGVTSYAEDGDEFDAPDPGPTPGDLVDRTLLQERIGVAWDCLGEEHRAVLSLHDIEGYSLEEVAEMIDAPLGTAKSRLHRARARLRQLLAEGTNSESRACRLLKDNSGG
jgi:RNA polymerase sigma factor (sigma-70 family)